MKRRKNKFFCRIAVSVLVAVMITPITFQVYAGTMGTPSVQTGGELRIPMQVFSFGSETTNDTNMTASLYGTLDSYDGENNSHERAANPNGDFEEYVLPETGYDQQPASRAEVAASIALYENLLTKHVNGDGEMPRYPRWEHEVPAGIMPYGYATVHVAYDADFGAEYYTFFVSRSTFSLNWNGEGTSANPYMIGDILDLIRIATEVNAGTDYAGVHFNLENDIDLAGQAWVPIGAVSNEIELSLVPNTSNLVGTDTAFKGIFDGGNFSISNFRVEAGTAEDDFGADYKGLFGIIENAVIKNLKINNASVFGGSAVGIIAGYATGDITIENVHIDNSTVVSVGTTNFGLGGMLGVVNMKAGNEFTISSSSVSGAKILSAAGYGRAGGVIGMIMSHQDEEYKAINSKVTIQDIEVSDCQINAMADSLGGLAGKVSFNNSCGNSIEIKNVQTDATVFIDAPTGDNAGGLIGHTVISGSSIGSTLQIEDCAAIGIIKARGIFSGGFIGFCEIDVSGNGSGEAEWIRIRNSYSEVNILAGSNGVGGFIGRTYAGDNMANGSILVENSFAAGDITNISNLAENTGGFIGRSSQNIVVRNSHATGDVYSFGSNNGGFIGNAEGSELGTVYIDNCYSTGHIVSGANNGGGFAGKLQYAQVKNSYSVGSVYTGGINTGGFVGQISDSRVENSYSAVHVDSLTKEAFGGFIGYNDGTGVTSNCFFDTTISQRTLGVGQGTSDGVTPLGTNQMTQHSSYSGVWDIYENSSGAAKGAASNAKPWYIDDGITYPYLFYQYDGKSNNETNYYLSSVLISDDSGGTYTPFLQSIIEFAFTQNSSRRLRITSAGAAGVFFPYTYGSSYEDYGLYKYIFSGEPLEVPSTEDYRFEASQPYSIGAVSKSDIIAFSRYTQGEISSNRPVYAAGDSDTYTYVHDRIEYTLEITNHSRDFDWNDLTVSIAIPVGVIPSAGEIRVDGAVIEESGLSGYEWNSETGELKIHLPDMPKSVGDSLSLKKITFEVNIEDEAASIFPDDPEADNIRVKGSITGTLYSENVSAGSYTVPIDDKNKDPVFLRYTVSYHGNGGQTTDEIISVEEGPYLPLTVHEVKSIEEIGFSRAGYTFLGWNTQADGNGQLYSAGEEIEINSSIELYAVWIQNPIFEFYKVDGKKASEEIFEGIGDAEFTIYLWTGAVETEIYPEISESDDWLEADIELSCSDEGSKGLVNFANLNISATYLLVETKAPAGYELPSAQWLIHTGEDGNIVLGDMLRGNAVYQITLNNIDISDEDDEAYIVNYAFGEGFELPNSGGTGTLKWMVTGVGLIGLGLTAISIRACRKNKESI